MSSDKQCCVPGCEGSEGRHKVLHRFPIPEKNKERFNAWLYAVGTDILGLENDHIAKYRRVCHAHFADKYICRNNKISINAVPTLHLKGPLSSSCKQGLLTSSIREPMQLNINLAKPSASTDFQFVSCSPSEMAIVEDEVRNDSEEENEIEVVVEEYEGEEQDSDDSEDDDDAVDAALERKVADLEMMIKADPYAYDDHIELVKALWALSDLERWRTAFDRVINLMALKPEDWLLRLRTETSLSHSTDTKDEIAQLFEKAAEDCYSVEILSDWCSWSVSNDNSPEMARQHLRKILECAGSDPLSGKVFWDALFDYEKAQLEAFGENDHDKPEYTKQKELVCRCLEDLVSRPLMQVEEAWPIYEKYVKATPSYEPYLVERTKERHEMALDFLQKITPYENKLLLMENHTEDKLAVYEDYLKVVDSLFLSGKYEPHYEDTIKAIYDRATSDCPNLAMLSAFAQHTRSYHSTSTYRRTLRSCSRRWPRTHHFWTLLMQQAERDKKDIAEVHASFEAALLRGMETYKEGEQLWLSYIEYKRRQTDFNVPEDVDRLRSTFRLAWDSLATCYGEEANDCEVPLYWARLEYQRMKAPKEGREVFEEIFKYGENKTMSKYWEALLRLEMNRSAPLAEHKLRDLFRRALKAVTDYPPAVATLWTDYERDYAGLDTLVECTETCEKKIREWREYYKTMKENMTGKKNTPKNKDNKRNKFDKNKHNDKKQNSSKQSDSKQSPAKQSDKQNSYNNQDDERKAKGKRKLDSESSSDVKRKREGDMDVDEPVKTASNNQGVKRSHSEIEEKDSKKQKVESEDTRAISREACTLFVSNLEFKINEQNLRDNLSQYGDIVSLRVKSGVKAFGGSICYCQYKNIESVEKALKNDRSLFDGRPMFFSRYSAKKTKQQFKYATSQENNKLFVKNLPFAHCNKDELTAIFEPHGKLNEIRVVTNKDGKPRGLAYIDYEDAESAAKAIEVTNGMLVGDRKIEVAISAPPPKTAAPVSLGLPKRDAGGGMRRTQLSSFIPSVLQKPVASTSKEDTDSEVTQQKPKSNSDFRSLLLRKQ